MDLAALTETKVTGNSVVIPLVWADYVIFTDDYGTYAMDRSGDVRRIFDQGFFSIFPSGDFLILNNSNGIFKLDTNDGSYVSLYSGKTQGMVLFEDYIFYTVFVPFDWADYPECGPTPPQGELWRMGLNGENTVFAAESVSFLSVHSDLIFFRDDTDYRLYSMNPLTLEKALVIDNNEFGFIDDPVFYDNFIFHIRARSLVMYSLATRETLVLNDMGSVWALRILDGYIYFILYSADVNGLCRIRLSDREFEVVASFMFG